MMLLRTCVEVGYHVVYFRIQTEKLETRGLIEAVVPAKDLNHSFADLRPVKLPGHPYSVVASPGSQRIEIAIVVRSNPTPLTNKAAQCGIIKVVAAHIDALCFQIGRASCRERV